MSEGQPRAASDAQLLRAWRGGDPAAADELFGRHGPSVFRFLRTKVGPAADTVTRQTFDAMCGDDDDPEALGFRTRVFSAARREMLRHFTAQTGVSEPNRARVVDLSDDAGSVSLDEARDLLLTALQHLPLDDQVALELHYWEQLPIVELARVLEMSGGRARVRLSRARRALRQRLRDLADRRELTTSLVGNLHAWIRTLPEALAWPGQAVYTPAAR